MRYQPVGPAAQYGYPDHDIDPREKGADWCMAYARASYFDWAFVYPKGIFANNGGDYDKFRLYAMGKQPVTPYKKMLGVDAQTDNTWLSVDWTIRPVLSKYRDMAISRLMKNSTGLTATAIDAMAKTEATAYYNDLKAKLAIRQMMQQQNPELAQHPSLMVASGEPVDLEELEMRVQQGEQFNRSMDAEQAIALALYQNKVDFLRRQQYENLFDYGAAGYKDWLDEDNMPRCRVVKPASVITNYCREANFSDMIHAGELIDVALTELATKTDSEGNLIFTEAELTEFANTTINMWGNPSILSSATTWFRPYDKFKARVLDIEFFSYNDYKYRDTVDKDGNLDFRKADYNRGKTSDKYITKKIQVVYKCKWVVGTDKVYDWGMVENQKRSVNPKKKAKAKLSYQFFAYNFHEMRAQGFMERLVPFGDEAQLTCLKIQNWKNRAVPSGWWIDLDALENVALNKGGKNMTPRQLLQMFFETGVLVGRSKDSANNPMGPNWKPVIPIGNSTLSELATLYQDFLNTINMIESITGYNSITAGDPNPKTLVPGYESAQLSTSDALYPIAFAEEQLFIGLGEELMCRMQQAVKKGEVSGYAPALNSGLLQFLKISPDLSLREYGIVLQQRTSDEQRMWLMTQMQQDIANGFLDTSDAITIINTHNAKQAQEILAYRVKKSKAEREQMEMAKIQEANQGNIMAAQAGEQARQQTLMIEGEIKLKEKQLEMEYRLKEKELEMQYKVQIARETNATKIEVQETANEGKAMQSSQNNK